MALETKYSKLRAGLSSEKEILFVIHRINTIVTLIEALGYKFAKVFLQVGK